ncbi:hypothetical protein [Natrarchaeobius chitinivorans]|uniref:Potassium transporter TrkA n=1 Tax=Natrarchaeobius chitinivorans TaxID=1679083 RepID=A0A3N6LVP4_NATCH|nr:hypothetical protein [Natrarchaeobius chitinivorans]RQG91804.1 hypothetical protein EA473_18580 [Natrarchaeobius chitinivorans]
MVDLPYETLLGVSYGLLVGFVPALAVGSIAAVIGFVRDRSIPVAAGVLTVPIAVATVVVVGVGGSGSSLAQVYRLSMVALVAGLLGAVATSHGNRIATELPRDRASPIVRGPTLSADAIDAVDAIGQVTIRPTGAIREFDGYPPLSPALRSTLEEGAWRFPADLQLVELEARLERRLRTEHELAQVDVSVDGRGRATIAAAPPAKGVATTLDAGDRAVTVTGLLPTGLAPGDTVVVGDDEAAVDGEVLAIDDEPIRQSERDRDERAGPVSAREHRRADAGTDGGERRLTVAVETTDAGTLLGESTRRISVRPTGANHEFEAAALLEATGRPVTALEPADDDALEPDATLGVRTGDRWQFAVGDSVPDGVDRAFVAESPRSTREVTSDD